MLCEKYKQCLDRDPQYLEYLDKIGQHFFGVPAPVKPRQGGMFSGNILINIVSSKVLLIQGLFDQLLNAMNEDSSDDETAGPSMESGPSGNNTRFVKRQCLDRLQQ